MPMIATKKKAFRNIKTEKIGKNSKNGKNENLGTNFA